MMSTPFRKLLKQLVRGDVIIQTIGKDVDTIEKKHFQTFNIKIMLVFSTWKYTQRVQYEYKDTHHNCIQHNRTILYNAIVKITLKLRYPFHP